MSDVTTLRAGQSQASPESALYGASNIPQTLQQISLGSLLSPLGGYDLNDISQYYSPIGQNPLPGAAGLGAIGLGTYGSGLDTVKKGTAKFSARRWLMDYGQGYTYNSFGVRGTPEQPNTQIAPGYPANPGDGPIMGTPMLNGPSSITNIGNGDQGIPSLSMI